MTLHECHKTSRWTVLPPMPLIGVGTAMVESVEHYVSRLAWTTGISQSALFRLAPPFDEPGNQTRVISKFCGPGPTYKRRIRNLEALTGNDTIRCGSLYVLDELISPTGVGTTCRRWCPRCLSDTDVDSVSEALIWKFGILEACPLHGCRLMSRCVVCGAKQTFGRPYDVRRSCWSCNASLAGPGELMELSHSQVWVNAQLCALVEYCATPGQGIVPLSALIAFIDGIIAVPSYRNRIPWVIRAVIGQVRTKGRSRRITVRTLLNVCALQGVGVLDALLDPIGASSEPLIDLWSGYRQLDLPMGSNEIKITMYNASIADVLRICRRTYLPSMRFFMKELKLNRDLARELSVDLYESYEASYRSQGTNSVLAHAERSFWYCAGLLRKNRQKGERRLCIRSVARAVQKRDDLAEDYANLITLSALYAIRAVERAKRRVTP